MQRIAAGRVLRRRIAIAICAVALAAVAAGSALASCDDHEVSYCNVLVSPGAWCSRGMIVHTYRTNAAHYDGAGNITVCQRMVGDVSGGIYSLTCGTDHAYGDIGPNCDALMHDWVKNESPWDHTIRGVGSY